MTRRPVPFCLLLLLALSGCAQSGAPPAAGFDPASLLDDGPKGVRFIMVWVNSTVVEPFPDAFSVERFSWPDSVAFEYDPVASPPGKTLVSHAVDTLWTVQENDTIILGTHTIRSNKHDIVQQTVAVSAADEAPFAYVGGIGFRFVPQREGRVLSYFGPYTVGTFTIALSYPGHPVPMPAQLDRDARFPLFYSDWHSNYTEVEARVVSNITLTYWGNATFVQDAGLLEHLRDHPEQLEAAFKRHPAQHETDGRVGMRTPPCGNLILRTYDPCMDPWMRPA